MSEYHTILGVSVNASMDEIKKAYRVQAQRYHPDFHSGPQKDFFTQMMQKINEAFTALTRGYKAPPPPRQQQRQQTQQERYAHEQYQKQQQREEYDYNVEDAEEICEAIFDVADRVPYDGEEFAAGVAATAESILNNINNRNRVTDKQMQALKRMLNALQKWIHD